MISCVVRSSDELGCSPECYGLSAGFNYTLAAVVGCAVALASVILFIRRRYTQARHLAVCAASVGIGGMPANAFVLGGLSPQPGGSFLPGAPGLFAVNRWAHLMPSGLNHNVVLILAVTLLFVVSYGLRLAGLRSVACAKLRFERHGNLALIMALATVASLCIGLLFEFRGPGGINNNIIFLQPTGWLMGLFSHRTPVRVASAANVSLEDCSNFGTSAWTDSVVLGVQPFLQGDTGVRRVAGLSKDQVNRRTFRCNRVLAQHTDGPSRIGQVGQRQQLLCPRFHWLTGIFLVGRLFHSIDWAGRVSWRLS